MSPQLAIILKGYPRLSETFIAQEIRALELRGYELCIISLRHPYDPASHPIHEEIEANVQYLPEYIHDDLKRVFKAWWRQRRQPGYARAFQTFMRDFRRDPTRNRLRRFGQALVMADELPSSVRHLYCHFMHTPASVTGYASQILEMSWSISAHAKDIWTVPEWELIEKLERIDWLVTCTSANRDYLAGLPGAQNKVDLLYHGLDFSRFDANPSQPGANDGSHEDQRVELISVGRAVDKKGYDFLLDALAKLDSTLHWRLIHIGGGELLAKLQKQAQRLNLESRIEWLGALPQTEVLARYRQSDIFVLPSRISDDGDRDGLPNVLMEAQSQQLACLSTRISGIPELIEHAETGWLVEQQNSEQLAEALYQLITDPSLRQRLAIGGFTRVRQHFSMQQGIDQLQMKLDQSMSLQQKS
ncbi:MAG: glycosyltransferase [Pseudomonadota bacterium]